MAIQVAKALNIEKKEQSVVFLLLTQSIFLGIFAGALDVGANALFLERYSADLIPQAFMLSGIVGIVFTSAYAYLQKRIPFKAFTVLNLLVAVLFTAALRFGFSYIEADWLAFALFVMMGPLIIISLLGFWGTAGRYFTLREGKRLFGIIDTGSIIGMILAFYAVPVLMQFNFVVYNTLMIGLVSLLIALLFQIIVIRRHKFIAIAKKEETGEKKQRSGFFSLFRKRYTSMMALFVVMSVIAAFFIHYSFMWATEVSYPDSKELTGFIGAFFGTMMIFTVVIKSTLYGWLMKNYGLRVALLISPALLLILTVGAALIGGIFGYTAEAAGFTMFFLVIALSKLFNKSLKDSMESPSMKILYQSLESNERYDVQARIDGIVNEITAFTAGLLMAGLLMISFVKVIHFSYILVAILIIWVLLGIYLYRSYRKTLNDSLASARSTIREEAEEAEGFPEVSQLPNYREMIHMNPYFYHVVSGRKMDGMLEHPNPELQKAAWNIISKTLYSLSEKEAIKIRSKTRDKEIEMLIDKYLRRNNLKNKSLDAAYRSANKDEVFAALAQTVSKRDRDSVPHIITLLRDRDLGIRSAAVEAAGILNARELGAYLVDYLGNPDMYAITWSSLVKMGEGILENLENAFHKTGAPKKVQYRIITAMEAIGGSKANEYLFAKINYHDRAVREAVLEGLLNNDFVPSDSQKPILLSAIYDAALAGAWFIAAEFVVRENDPENGLLEALAEELLQANTLLFNLLAITYDKHAIDHVKSSLMDAENEDTGFAIELLNLIVDDQVFAYLEPYFDQMAIPDKVKKLQNEMPVEILSYESLLTELINKDGLYTGNYIRLCAINAIGMHEEMDASQELAAQVFHPDAVLSESAYTVLSLKSTELHKHISLRFPEERVETASLDEGKKGMQLLMSIVDDLHQWPVFAGVKLEALFILAKEFLPAEETDLNDENLVTLLYSREQHAPGALKLGMAVISSHYPELQDQIRDLSKQKQTKVYQIRINKFRELLFDNKDLLEAFIGICSNESIHEIALKQAE